MSPDPFDHNPHAMTIWLAGEGVKAEHQRGQDSLIQTCHTIRTRHTV